MRIGKDPIKVRYELTLKSLSLFISSVKLLALKNNAIPQIVKIKGIKTNNISNLDGAEEPELSRLNSEIVSFSSELFKTNAKKILANIDSPKIVL